MRWFWHRVVAISMSFSSVDRARSGNKNVAICVLGRGTTRCPAEVMWVFSIYRKCYSQLDTNTAERVLHSSMLHHLMYTGIPIQPLSYLKNFLDEQTAQLLKVEVGLCRWRSNTAKKLSCICLAFSPSNKLDQWSCLVRGSGTIGIRLRYTHALLNRVSPLLAVEGVAVWLLPHLCLQILHDRHIS